MDDGGSIMKRIPAGVRIALHERAQDCCEICGKWGANNAHHRRNQGQGGPDTLSNLMLLCGSGTTGCHGEVTAKPDWAESLGYTIKGTQLTPAEAPVLRFDLTVGRKSFVWLTDDGDVLSEAA